MRRFDGSILLSGSAILLSSGTAAAQSRQTATESTPGSAPRNVIFILSDDHRHDYMGFLGTVPWLRTPNMDRLARDGAYVKNAFVTTALSSPSRASILTGLYSHEHEVVDNSAPMPDDLVFFPQYLQEAGYTTGFFGKWHMGNDTGNPQPGFDHWESFAGQGTYYSPRVNINGEWTNYDSDVYITDLLTDHAIDFVKDNSGRPFFVYLSHKAVHDPFQASPKHEGIYSDEQVVYPPSYYTPTYGTPDLPSLDAEGKAKANREWYGEGRMPDWVKNQRESWHGVDYSYHGRSTFEEECLKYCESLTSLDESIGRLLDYLEKEGLLSSTLIIYMGDNGFSWGEHGLIDKRTFYETSVKVPMLAHCPELIEPGTVVENMVQNVDIGPTVMEACGVGPAPRMRGFSMLPLLAGKTPDKWRERIFYEYYWEYEFPQTPTTFGVRTDRYKLIRYHGVWDTNEFYDLQEDPFEMNNLIDSPEHQGLIRTLAADIFTWLEDTDGMEIPLKQTVRKHNDHRNRGTY